MKIKLKEILEERGMSVYALSKATQITPNNLGKIVKGETTSIKYSNLEAICKELNVTPNDIFSFDE